MNIGLAYYKEYYQAVDLRPERAEHADYNKGIIKAKNDELLKYSLDDVTSRTGITDHELTNTKIELKTTYPGLLAGSGYLHEFSIEEALMLGFSFDHTSGLPYIPASSVKGVLRFACVVNNGEYLEEQVGELIPGLVDFDSKKFVEEVFDGTLSDGRIGIYKRDLFFDAMPVRSNNNNHHFLGDDFITPHIHKDDRSMDGLKNPIPLKFIKILPEVTFRFNFLLRGKKAGLSAKNREDLFKRILLDLGIGAKTNVGYGQFAEESEEEKRDREEKALKIKTAIEEAELESKKKAALKEKELDDKGFNDSFKEIHHDLPVEKFDRTFDGFIFRKAETKYYIRYHVDGKSCEFSRIKKKFKPKNSNPKEGDKVVVRIQCDPHSKEHIFSISVTIQN